MQSRFKHFEANLGNLSGMKHYPSFEAFLSDGASALTKGPIALLFLEDDVEATSTIRHCVAMGFRAVVALGVPDIVLPDDLSDIVHRVHLDISRPDSLMRVVNTVIEQAPSQWIYYGYNTEYLFFPFCENRTIGEMLAFHTEERRDALLTYVVDLYAGDLQAHPNAVSLDDTYMDKSGYYALARKDKDNNFVERQLDFFGGLRWRFEEHVPLPRRRIDRISIFRAKPGLRLQGYHTFNDQEYNTYACPWHHSITAALCSFRTAKALKRNPVSAGQISTFRWHNSAPFEWHSQQLLDLGLMEPGQWF